MTVRQVAALFALAYAADAGAEISVLQEGRIRAVYRTEGRDAVRPDDINTNGVPDQVEDVLAQTVAARLLFVEVLGFPDPLQTERFRTAATLDIWFKGAGPGVRNGTAFDELQRTRGVPGDPTGALCIAFNVLTTLDPKKNVTPARVFPSDSIRCDVLQEQMVHRRNGAMVGIWPASGRWGRVSQVAFGRCRLTGRRIFSPDLTMPLKRSGTPLPCGLIRTPLSLKGPRCKSFRR